MIVDISDQCHIINRCITLKIYLSQKYKHQSSLAKCPIRLLSSNPWRIYPVVLDQPLDSRASNQIALSEQHENNITEVFQL